MIYVSDFYGQPSPTVDSLAKNLAFVFITFPHETVKWRLAPGFPRSLVERSRGNFNTLTFGLLRYGRTAFRGGGGLERHGLA